MPVQFLEQLFSTLRRAGLLTTQRGVKGGLPAGPRARRSPSSRSSRPSTAGSGRRAEAGGIWAEGVEALRDVFRSTTIADIARREASEAGTVYYI